MHCNIKNGKKSQINLTWENFPNYNRRKSGALRCGVPGKFARPSAIHRMKNHLLCTELTSSSAGLDARPGWSNRLLVALSVILLLVWASQALSQPGGNAPGVAAAFDHVRAGFPLTGVHERVPCESCHIQGVFRGTPKDCSTCHSPGSRRATSVKPTNHIPTVQSCDTCHRTTTTGVGWKANTFTHAIVPANACAGCHNNIYLSGKPASHIPTTADCSVCHTSTTSFSAGGGKPANHIPTSGACTVCHANGNVGPNSGVMNHTGIVSGCATCHAAAVGATFVAPVKTPPTNHIPTSAACETCHSTSNFTAFGPGTPMSHTGIVSGCTTCHAVGTTGTAFFGVTPLPQGTGHIPVTGDCATCHTSTTKFGPGTAMNHTGILSGCATCHETGKSFVGVTIVTRPTQTQVPGHPTTGDCSTCHTSTVSFALGVTGGKPANHIPTTQACTLCHTNSSDYSVYTMNHTGIASGCSTCHGTGLSFANIIPKAPPSTHIPTAAIACEGCHSPANFATFGGTTMNHTPVAAMTCMSCHEFGMSWYGVRIRTRDGANHHAGVDCKGCHNTTSFDNGNNGTSTSSPATATLSATSLTFAAQATGTTSTAQTVILYNSGTTTMTVSNVAISGANATDFAQTNTCGTLPASLAGGKSCTVTVTFKPAATGARNATLTFTDTSNPTTQTVALFGTGGAGVGAMAALSATTLTFASQATGTTSAVQTVTLSNTGSAALSISAIAISGTNAADYAQTNSCGTLPASLPAGASCSLSVTFKPATTGARNATITVTDNATPTMQTVTLTGTGGTATSGPAATLSATSLAFANRATGTTSPAQTVTLSNTGSTALTINSIALSGTNANNYAQTSTCGTLPATLVAGANCAINVTFTPSATGTRTATITVTDNATPTTQTVALTGIGGASSSGPAATLSATTLTFASQATGTTSPIQTVTLANTGSAVLTISSITLSGTNANNFARVTTCGTLPATLTAGANCLINVTFTPSGTGTRAATITVTDNAAPATQAISLTGTGGTAGATAAATVANAATANSTTAALTAPTSAAAPNTAATLTAPAAIAGSARALVLPGTPLTGIQSPNAAAGVLGAPGMGMAPPSIGSSAGISGAAVTMTMPGLPGSPAMANVPGMPFRHAGVMPGRCMTCHNGSTAPGKPANHIPTAASCDSCHRTTTWKPATFSHIGVAPGSCITCHNGMTASGKSNNHFVTTKTCDACHRTTGWRPVMSYSHLSPFYRPHNPSVTCISCHTTGNEIIAWKFAAYKPTCAGCHADRYKPNAHKKVDNPPIYYTVTELKDCSGSCHLYTNATFTVVKQSRTGRHMSTGGF
jgi:hypothetical protein